MIWGCLYYVVWGGCVRKLCSEKITRLDPGESITGRTLCPDLTSFIHCGLPACLPAHTSFMLPSSPSQSPNVERALFLSAVSVAGSTCWGWPGRLAWPGGKGVESRGEAGDTAAAKHLRGNEIIRLLSGKHNESQCMHVCVRACLGEYVYPLFMGVKLPQKPYVVSPSQKQLVNLCVQRPCWLSALLSTHRVAGESDWPHSYGHIITAISSLMAWPEGKRSGVNRLSATKRVLSGWGVSHSTCWPDCCVTSRSPSIVTLLWLDGAYRGNVALCVCMCVFVGITECLHSSMCVRACIPSFACVSKLADDRALVRWSLWSGSISHLVAFLQQELSQVGTILKPQAKNIHQNTAISIAKCTDIRVRHID